MNIDLIHLSASECHALSLAKRYADIYDVETAARLRAIHQRYPEFVHISSPFNAANMSTGTLPFVHAEVTAEGRAALRQLRAREDLPPCLGEAYRDTIHDIYRTGFEVSR